MSPEQASSPIMEAKDISVVYGGRKVLDVTSLQVTPGKVLAIIGPNGSGKTTLLLCLALLTRPTSGNILFQGHVIPDGTSALQMRRKFAVVFQEPLLLNTSVWENVSLGLKLRGFKPEETNQRVHKWLERFGIAHLAQRQARTLSGGEAQRTSLARAFALQPEVLFLDEPFAALDVPTRQSLFGDMVNVLQNTRFTTVMVTHDRNEAQTLAHQVAVLMKGKIVQTGSPREVFTTPATEEIAKFVGIENILCGIIAANREAIVDINVSGQTIEGVSQCRMGSEVYVFIRPEDITISLARSPSSARNVFSGNIVSLISSGPLVRVNLDCGFPLVALITRMSAENLGLEIGKTVYASFKATAIHIIGVK